MGKEKSILSEALLDIKNIKGVLDTNAKEILRNVAREEIDSVVKESLMREDFTEEDLESDNEIDANSATTDVNPDSNELERDDMQDIETSDEVEPEMEPEMSMDATALDGEEMDLTNASDDDVIAIYKKLSGNDEIEIVGDEIHLNITEPGEYVVKTSELMTSDESNEEDLDIDDLEVLGSDESDDEDNETPVEFEIELADTDETGEAEAPSDLEDVDSENDEEETEEPLDEKLVVGLAQNNKSYSDLTKTGGAGKNKLDESLVSKSLLTETQKKYNTLLTESKKLKSENEQFRSALKEFRNQLVETVVFNSNLTYVTRLFMEHSTTKAEKQNIIKRFDTEVSNLTESKKLYKTIVNELSNKNLMNESIENKLTKTTTSSTSTQLNESTAYVDPQINRIKELIFKK